MGSVVIDSPPVHTPADEWARDTADALKPSPFIHDNARVVPASSAVSTPGVDFPGAYPRDAIDGLADGSPYKLQEAVGQGIETVKQYLPAQETVDQHLQTAKTYIPAQEEVTGALGAAVETAKQYLPEKVVNAVESVLPRAMVSEDGTTPPASSLDHTGAAKPAFLPADSSASFSSNPQITEDGISDNLGTSSAPISNMTGAVGGVVLGSAVGGVATDLDPSTQVRPSKLEEPRISTSNIQVPYGDASNDLTLTEPHFTTQDSGIQKTNAALANMRSVSNPVDERSQQNIAPFPPPKPDNEDELVGRQTSSDVPRVNTQPTHDHVQSDRGLNAPPSVSTNRVGGGLSSPSDHDRRVSTDSQTSDGSGSGKDEHSPKKGRGSRLVAKVKEKLHHKGN